MSTDWTMWAGAKEKDGEVIYWYPALDARYPKHYGHEPVQVVVTESPEGPYWGWIDAADDKPIMVYPRESLFSMCFPYGPKIEERAGKGRIVRLSIVPAGQFGGTDEH